tara:strand:- start:254 stop:940 length:687 start_codon:yes stop_codon:yes gene_type:complete
MKLIRNPLNEVEVEEIVKNIKPTCEQIKSFAMWDNDNKKTIVEVPEWKDHVSYDKFLELSNKKPILDTNESKNLFNGNEAGMQKYINKIRDVLKTKYQVKVDKRGAFYYPPTGFMGWHTNCGTPGERFYITWASEDKKSFFRYYDDEKDEIITDYDDKGLTIRQFTIPTGKPYFWHCVGSECDRFSFGFLVNSNIILDFDTYQKLLNVVEKDNISDYITELINNAKHS